MLCTAAASLPCNSLEHVSKAGVSQRHAAAHDVSLLIKFEGICRRGTEGRGCRSRTAGCPRSM
eukprot:1796385-Rhodomonas_salina.1